jgi:hypothetical protein
LKHPRDLSGEKLARLLRRFGYEITRQTGSYLRLTSAHASYLEVTKEQLAEDLFG